MWQPIANAIMALILAPQSKSHARSAAIIHISASQQANQKANAKPSQALQIQRAMIILKKIAVAAPILSKIGCSRAAPR